MKLNKPSKQLPTWDLIQELIGNSYNLRGNGGDVIGQHFHVVVIGIEVQGLEEGEERLSVAA